MKRLMLAAVAGLCTLAPSRAQEGALAPTVPIVPTPMMQDGRVLHPAGGTVASGPPKMFSLSKWSPFRSSVVATSAQPAPAPAYPYHGYAIPPLPAGVSTGVVTADANCGAAGCGKSRGGFTWERLKAWLCFHYTPTGLPKCQPTPYITPLQGMFPCASGCGYGCAPGHCGHVQPGFAAPPVYGQPGYPLGQPQPQPMPQPAPPVSQPMPKPGSDAPPVVMPPRGMQGSSLHPTGPAVVQSGIPGYTIARPATLPGTVVGASGRR